MKLSLIQTSQNRQDELKRFVESLNGQVGIDFNQIQFIFVDQEDNLHVFDDLDKKIEFVYIKYHHCSLSHARNIGLKHVTGDYVGFPDDDCWYEKDVLKFVFSSFKSGYSGVIARSTDENGITTNKSPQKSQLISLYNHCGAISYTIFLKYISGLFFDEKLGVGSSCKLSSGEETDFLIRSIKILGISVFYDCNIIIHHPKGKRGNFKSVRMKQYEYARGWGYLLKKHDYPLGIILKSFIRPIGGMILSFLTFNQNGVLHSFYIFKGRIEGFFYQK